MRGDFKCVCLQLTTDLELGGGEIGDYDQHPEIIQELKLVCSEEGCENPLVAFMSRYALPADSYILSSDGTEWITEAHGTLKDAMVEVAPVSPTRFLVSSTLGWPELLQAIIASNNEKINAERGRVLKVEDYIPTKLIPRGWEQQQILRNTASGLPASVFRAGQKDERPWHAISASWNDLPAHCIERFTKHLLLYASQTLSQIGFDLSSGFVTHYERIPETSVAKEWLLIEAPNGALARAFFYMFEGYVLETEDEGVSYMLNLYHCRFRSESMSPMRRAKVL